MRTGMQMQDAERRRNHATKSYSSYNTLRSVVRPVMSVLGSSGVVVVVGSSSEPSHQVSSLHLQSRLVVVKRVVGPPQL